jgi:hypothetical protein
VPADREGYFGDRHYEYWLPGLWLHDLTMQQLARHDVRRRGRYVELGAASGRSLRHFALETFAENWAFDLN